MRLLLKFNLFFLPLMALGLVGAGYLVREAMQRNAQNEVLQNAQVMMETATATRSYTTKQIAPLLQHERFKVDRTANALQQTLDKHLPDALQQAADRLNDPKEKKVLLATQKQVVDAVKAQPRELPEAEFYPQTVPAYAATEIFNYFRTKYPDYTYKEATLNPTNPRDRTVDWEADVVNAFRKDPSKASLSGERDSAIGKTLYLGVPIKIANSSCLTCHSTPDKAPPEMIKTYGSANGFGWKMDEVIGAQIVSVPAQLPLDIANKAFESIAVWLVGIFAAVFLLVNFAVAILTRRPAAMPSGTVA
jgi:Protein of unknown function (DUF3365)